MCIWKSDDDNPSRATFYLSWLKIYVDLHVNADPRVSFFRLPSFKLMFNALPENSGMNAADDTRVSVCCAERQRTWPGFPALTDAFYLPWSSRCVRWYTTVLPDIFLWRVYPERIVAGGLTYVMTLLDVITGLRKVLQVIFQLHCEVDVCCVERES